MTDAPNDIAVAPWVSWRVYRTPSETRCFISNERLRTYLLLTEESAQLFDLITSNVTYTELYDMAVMLGVADELDGFLGELTKEMILFKENSANASHLNYCAECDSRQQDHNIYKEMLNWAVDNGFLFSCHFDLTYQCNQKCFHCFNPNAQSRFKGNGFSIGYVAKELETNEILLAIDDLYELGCFNLTLSGGEATLRTDFLNIVQYARKLGFCVELYSNGQILDKKFVDKLEKYWLHKVSISIYSSDADEHDAFTGVKGSWQKSINAFKFLQQLNIKTAFKCIPTKLTINKYFDIISLGSILADSVTMDMTIAPGYGKNLHPISYLADENEMIAIFAKEIAKSPNKDAFAKAQKSPVFSLVTY